MGRKARYPLPSEAVKDWIKYWFVWWNTPLSARKPPEEYTEIIKEREKEASSKD